MVFTLESGYRVPESSEPWCCVAEMRRFEPYSRRKTSTRAAVLTLKTNPYGSKPQYGHWKKTASFFFFNMRVSVHIRPLGGGKDGITQAVVGHLANVYQLRVHGGNALQYNHLQTFYIHGTYPHFGYAHRPSYNNGYSGNIVDLFLSLIWLSFRFLLPFLSFLCSLREKLLLLLRLKDPARTKEKRTCIVDSL